MKTKKISLRINESNFETVKLVADYLKEDISSVIRDSLRFGLNSLLKFETSGKMDLKKLENPKEPENKKEPDPIQRLRERYPALQIDQDGYIILEDERLTEAEFLRRCEISRTPFLREPK